MLCNFTLFQIIMSSSLWRADIRPILNFSIQNQHFLPFSINIMFILLGHRFYLLAFKVLNLFKDYFFNVAQIAS